MEQEDRGVEDLLVERVVVIHRWWGCGVGPPPDCHLGTGRHRWWGLVSDGAAARNVASTAARISARTVDITASIRLLLRLLLGLLIAQPLRF